MLTKTGRLALAAAVLCIGFGWSGRAEAGGIVLSTPTGLSAGDSFRFVFVTDATTVATSSSISTYNTFVNTDATNEAGGGLVTYNGVAITWLAIASTPSIDAITNVGVTGAPVYLAGNGALIATSDGTGSGGLWSGSLMNPIDQDLAGVTQPQSFPWTGTLTGGGGAGIQQLGTANPIAGNNLASSGDWVQQGEAPSNDILSTMYGISQVLIVPNSVPEPSSLLMAGTAVTAGCAFRWSRRRRKERRQKTVEQRDTLG